MSFVITKGGCKISTLISQGFIKTVVQSQAKQEIESIIQKTIEKLRYSHGYHMFLMNKISIERKSVQNNEDNFDLHGQRPNSITGNSISLS